MSSAGIVLIALLMAAGLLGTIIPLIPGLPIVWGAAVLYGLSAGFDGPGWPAIVLITLLAVGGMIAASSFPIANWPRAARRGPRSSAAVVGGDRRLLPDPRGRVADRGGRSCLPRRTSAHRERPSRVDEHQESGQGFGLGILVELAAGMAMVAVWIAWVMFDWILRGSRMM